MEIRHFLKDNKLSVALNGELDEYSAEYVRISLDSLLKDISCLTAISITSEYK